MELDKTKEKKKKGLGREISKCVVSCKIENDQNGLGRRIKKRVIYYKIGNRIIKRKPRVLMKKRKAQYQKEMEKWRVRSIISLWKGKTKK